MTILSDPIQTCMTPLALHLGERDRGSPASSCKAGEQMFQLQCGHRCEDLQLENNNV